MTRQPEQVLENNLVSQLVGLGQKAVTIKTENLVTKIGNSKCSKVELLQKLFV